VDECDLGYISGPTGANCVAFENSGFLQNNTPANPYSDDVARCLNSVFNATTIISVTSKVNASQGAYSADSNSNTIGVGSNEGDPNYQTGMMLDAIVAAGTPSTPVTVGTTLATGAAGLGTGPSKAYTYKDLIYDMVDWYSYCETLNDSGGFDGTNNTNSGGWHYDCQEESGDNSVSQWAAIGIIPARRKVGLPTNFDPLPTQVLTGDQSWLTDSFTAVTTKQGYFGYTGSTPLWGPYADTPSGLVQLAMSGKGRGTTVNGQDLWDSAETFIRDNFDTPSSNLGEGGPGLKEYYYGMLSFTKSMLLHDNNDTSIPALAPAVNPAGMNTVPITTLQSLDDPNTCAAPGVPVTAPGSGAGPCYPPIDWYAAQTSAFGGTDPTNGVARTLVAGQAANGSWFGHNYTSAQYYLETGFAITMLNKTVFQPVPVACFTTSPSSIDSGGGVVLNGSCSVDQNPANTLVSWQWDISGTGAGFSIGPGSPLCATPSCSQLGTPTSPIDFTLPPGQPAPYDFPVRLKVTDSAGLTATVTGSVVIANPPNPPFSDPGGPYNFCPNTSANGQLIYAPFLLDGSKSTNPDQGKTDGTPGAPPSTIVSYAWDLTGACQNFTTIGEQINATTAFDIPADFGTSFNVCLKVTNNDNLAFPKANLTAGLSSVNAAGVTIHQPTDEACTHCVQTLGAKAKGPTPGVPGNVQLYWTDTDTNAAIFPIDHYNVYRSTSATFLPYEQIAGANSVYGLPSVPVSNPPGGTVFFVDNNVAASTTYYYRIAPATVNDTETCQGNVTLAVTVAK